jgi:hypothetical protein
MTLTSFRGSIDRDIHKYIHMLWVRGIKAGKNILGLGWIGGCPLKCDHAFSFFVSPHTTRESLFLTKRLKSLTF